MTFHRSAAAAQAAGFRACKRCLPDATPGSPDWDVSADVAGRAMRLIGDGLVEREGVEGLAGRVGYTPRHLQRLLTAELGAGPLALARARRAQNARILIETTAMAFADVAFAAGFASVRQFNDTIREVYAGTPTQLRAARGRRTGATTHPQDGAGDSRVRVELRLPVRAPYAGDELLRFLAAHLVPGVGEQRTGLVRPDPLAAARSRPGPADLPRRRAADGRRVHARGRRPARRRGRRRALSPAARRRRRPGHRRRRAGSLTPGWPRWCGDAPACGCRAASTATRSRSAP